VHAKTTIFQQILTDIFSNIAHQTEGGSFRLFNHVVLSVSGCQGWNSVRSWKSVVKSYVR